MIRSRCAEAGTGGIRLSDDFTHQTTILTVVGFARRRSVGRITARLERNQRHPMAVQHVDAPIERLPEAIFRWTIVDVTVWFDVFVRLSGDLLRRPGTFEDRSTNKQATICAEGLPNRRPCRLLEGRHDRQLLLYGIPNRDKARLTIITVTSTGHKFDSILVFDRSGRIPRNRHGLSRGRGNGVARIPRRFLSARCLSRVGLTATTIAGNLHNRGDRRSASSKRASSNWRCVPCGKLLSNGCRIRPQHPLAIFASFCLRSRGRSGYPSLRLIDQDRLTCQGAVRSIKPNNSKLREV